MSWSAFAATVSKKFGRLRLAEPDGEADCRQPATDKTGGDRVIFANDLGPPEGPVLLPDGSWAVTELAVNRGCVSRLSPDGSVCVAFGPRGQRRIYVTDDDLGQIEAYDVGVDGLGLYT
jgi:hypothetical protein